MRRTITVIALAALAVAWSQAAASAEDGPAADPPPATSPCEDRCINAGPFGAPADGVTDAWPALQQAANLLQPGMTLYVPSGAFLLSHPLRMPSGTFLTGAGAERTTLLLDRRNWCNFGYTFLVTAGPAGSPSISADVVVSDLTVNGNRTNVHPDDSTPDGPANAGGGIKVGSGWTVSGVRFTNVNYFKLWIYQVHGVSVTGNQFDALGGSASGNDNIGGGQDDGVTISGNTIDASATGNAVDLTRSTHVSVLGNTVNGAAGASHGIYLEGVTDSVVAGNVIDHAGISVQSERSYGLGLPVRNPQGVTVRDNTVDDAPAQAISVRYDTSVYGQLPGGGNTVADNLVRRPGRAGVAVIGCASDTATAGDVIAGNTVTDPFVTGLSSWNTGCGSVDPSGLVILVGAGDEITGNSVIDSAEVPTGWWGISVGARGGMGVPVITGMSGNTATGVRRGLLVVNCSCEIPVG
jgi:trimeric autotransporter adhesin